MTSKCILLLYLKPLNTALSYVKPAFIISNSNKTRSEYKSLTYIQLSVGYSKTLSEQGHKYTVQKYFII